MTRCNLCPGDHSCVPPSGPCNSPIRFIGEGPGWDEDKKLIPFVGKTGREVNEHYLPLAGLRRDNQWFWNAMLCMPKGQHGKLDMNRAADRELVNCCANTHLLPELRRCNDYSLLVLMGAFACHVIDPTINLELQHGIPLETKWGTVFPMYHPAGGIHEPKKMLQIRNDWVRLRKYLAGKLILPEDEYAEKEDYKEIKGTEDLDESLRGMSEYPIANDTESTRDRNPFCLTYSVRPGEGRLIQATRLDVLECFQSYIHAWRGPILWHNWLYDGAVVKRMGLKFPRRLIVDTMVKSFHLGNLPQGLKALAYRELGMEMQDFDDLVSPYSSKLVIEYYRRAYNEEWEKPPAELVRDKDGKWKPYQPQSMSTKLKRFFTDYQKSEGDKDVFTMWTKNWADQQQTIQEKCGRWPGKCITHVPFDEVLHYACRDADATLRLWPIIQKMTAVVRHTTQENWRDAA